MKSTRLKRILVLSDYYYPYYKGGYGLRCKAVTDELRERGYEMYVLTSRWRASEMRQPEDYVYRLLHIQRPEGQHALYRRFRHVEWALMSRIDRRIARRVIRELDPDIVYVWNMANLSLAPLAPALALEKPLVFDLGEYWLLRRYKEICLEPNGLKRNYRLFINGLTVFDPMTFSHLLTNSEVLKQGYVEAGFPPVHITVIPRGLQAKFILDAPPPPLSDSTVRLLYAGRLTEAKGVHLAIQAVAMLHQELSEALGRSVSLDIIGEGEDEAYAQELRELVASLGAQDIVYFVGRIDQEALIDRYKSYHAVLFPAIWVEPFGGVVAEAMAQGTCAIASDRGGPAELITHGHDGLLVEPEDPRAIAEAVVDLVQHPGLLQHIRQNAVATVREHYTIEHIVDRVEDYLNKAWLAHSRRSEDL